MPSLTGRVALILTVSDAERSAQWYAEVFGMVVTSDYSDSTGTTRSICLQESTSGLNICVQSDASTRNGLFDEGNVGLDHAEFLVQGWEDLDLWLQHLDSLGIEHSGIKEPMYSRNAMITFRDPDRIQLELFWPGSRPPA